MSEEARSLMRGRTGTAVMAIFKGCDPCREEAEVVRDDLALIGITVKIEELPDPVAASREPDAKIDLVGMGTGLDYADPASFLAQMLLRDMPRSWLPKGVASQVERLTQLTGAERESAAVALADQLATRKVPLAADLTPTIPSLLSPRLGCRVFPPFGYGVDLAALCLNKAA